MIRSRTLKRFSRNLVTVILFLLKVNDKTWSYMPQPLHVRLMRTMTSGDLSPQGCHKDYRRSPDGQLDFKGKNPFEDSQTGFVGSFSRRHQFNSAIFSVVNALLLKPFPFESRDRLVAIRETSPRVSSRQRFRRRDHKDSGAWVSGRFAADSGTQPRNDKLALWRGFVGICCPDRF